jgi:sulfotransferase
MNQLHFCGGLPRAGSTILMNILQQNPRIFTTGTCALNGLIQDSMLVKSRFREQFQAMSVEQADKAMYGAVHGATKGWFEALTDKPVVISKNRSWSGVFHIYPEAKYICMVRDIRDVVESFEKVNNKSLALQSFGDTMTLSTAMHEQEKYRFYFNEHNALTASLQLEFPRLMETFKKTTNKIIFIRYEDLTKDPILILKKLYTFLGEEWFEHDLNNISQSELYEHDNAYFRERTDHVTNPKFQYYKEPQRLLSTNFHANVMNEYAWFYEGFYPDASKYTPN